MDRRATAAAMLANSQRSSPRKTEGTAWTRDRLIISKKPGMRE
jgi:hypothetical protein